MLIGTYMGHKMYFDHGSHSCPSLKLYGYGTERQLKNAIRREVHKRELSLVDLSLRLKEAIKAGRLF